MKRILSLLLICIMLLSLAPGAFAAENAERTFPLIRSELTTESLIKYGNIMFKPGVDYAVVRGVNRKISAPFTENGVVYFPLRDVAEILNTRVEWNSRKTSITWYLAHYEYIFEIGSSKYVRYEGIEDTVETFDLGGKTILGADSKVYIPLKNLCEVAELRYSTMDSGIVLFGTKEARWELSDFKKSDKEFVESLFETPKDADRIEKTFYVDPVNGRDSHDGSLEYPFRSILTAKEEVRKYKTANGQNGNIIVYLRGGNYTINKTIDFTVEDSGLNGYKVIYSAYPGETVIIDGGEKIEGWEKVDDKIYRAYIGKTISSLYEGDNFSRVARHPNEGYYNAIAASGGPSDREFIFKEGQFPEVSDITGVRWAGWAGGPSGHWRWFYTTVPVSTIDYENRTVKMSLGASSVLGTGSAYTLQGAREFLDAPGEFYSSKDGYVYYYPYAEDINSVTIIASQPNIFTIKGNNFNDVAENIVFHGLTLRNTSSNMFECSNFANVYIDSCILRNVGGHAVNLTGSRMVGLHLTNCDISNVGSSAFNQGLCMRPDDNMGKHHVIKNNRIKDVGLIIKSSCAVEFFGGYTYIGYNYVSDGPCNGIKYRAGNDNNHYYNTDISGTYFSSNYTKEEFDEELIYYYNPTSYNTIEYNEVVNFMWDSQDGGGIYTQSAGQGNIIRNNLIRDLECNVSFMMPLYHDSYSRGIKVYNNVVYDNQNNPAAKGKIWGTHLPELSYDGAVWNNLYVDNHRGGQLPMSVYYTNGNGKVPITKNISVNSGKDFFSPKATQPKEENKVLIDNNMFYNETTNVITDGLPSGVKENKISGLYSSYGKYDERGMKTMHNSQYHQHSLFGQNPLFVDKENGDLRLRYTSPAYRTGYRDIDFANIGLTKDFDAVKGTSPDKIFVDIRDYDTDSFISLKAGDYAYLDTTVRDNDGYVVSDSSLTFVTNNPTVATVDAFGRITATGSGIAKLTVTASKGDKSVSTQVDVLVDDEIVSLECDTTIDLLRAGEHSTIRPYYVTKYGRILPADNVSYASDNTSVLTVDAKGFATAVATGEAIVKVTDSKGFKTEITIGVKDSLFDSFELVMANSTVELGKKQEFSVILKNEKGNVIQEIPGGAISIISGDEKIFTVSEKSGSIYEIVPKAPGGSYLNVQVELDGKALSKNVNIYVSDPVNDKIDTSWKHANYGTHVDADKTPTDGSSKVYESGLFEFTTQGYDFWNKECQGSFAYKEIEIDPNNPVAEVKLKFEMSPNLKRLLIGDTSKDNNAAFGVMIRSQETANSANINFRWQIRDGALVYVYRTIADTECGYNEGGNFDVAPELRLIYDGGVVATYYRNNPTDPWMQMSSDPFQVIDNKLYIGIAGYSQNFEEDGEPMYISERGLVEVNVGSEVDKSDLTYDATNAQ